MLVKSGAGVVVRGMGGCNSMWGMSEGYKTGGDNRSKEPWEKIALQVEGGSEDQKHF